MTARRGKTQNKTAQKSRAKTAKFAKQLASINVPGHINRIDYDSPEWEEIATSKEGEFWKRGHNLVKGYWTGQEESLRQPAFVDKDPETVISEILALNTDPVMQAIEEKFADSFGGYAARPYEEWAQNVHASWQTTTWCPDRDLLDKAKNQVVAELRSTMEEIGWDFINPLPLHEGYEKTTKGRNSGYPYFTSKWAADPVQSSFYYYQAKRLLAGEDVLKGTPHILFKRVQPKGLNVVKMRPVMCPPKTDAIAGKCFTDQFVKLFKLTRPYYGFNGGDSVYKVLDKMMEKEHLIESDFSSFDARCQMLMVEVWDVIKRLVHPDYHSYLAIVLDYYQNSILITPEGILSGKDGKLNGLNSGDAWTSVVGTLANSIATIYTMEAMKIKNYERLTFGDDIALATDEPFNSLQFERRMSELGMDCNRAKQSVTSGEEAFFSFLGWYHFRKEWKEGNQGKFPMCRIASGLYYREFYIDYDGLMNSGELSPDEKELLKQANKKCIDLIAFSSKLNQCRNNRDFPALVAYFRDNEPNKMATDIFAPYEKLQTQLRNGRRTRNLGLLASPVVQELYNLEF